MSSGPQLLDILLLFVIAALLFKRLRNVLGAEPDEDENNNADNDMGNVVNLNDARKPVDMKKADELAEKIIAGHLNTAEVPEDPVEKGLYNISSVDPSFDADEFSEGAKIAFEMIVGAFAEGDIPTLEGLLASDIEEPFVSAVEQRKKNGETLECQIIGFNKAEIVEASIADYIAKITVHFETEQAKTIKNVDGEVIGGDPNYIQTVTDIWTFARDVRSNNPNWRLVATKSA